MLRWTFRRGDELLTCQIHRRRPGLFRLSVVPHGSIGAGVLETFSSTMRALHRHAAIAADLRQAGWSVVSYGGETNTPIYRSPAAIAA